MPIRRPQRWQNGLGGSPGGGSVARDAQDRPPATMRHRHAWACGEASEAPTYATSRRSKAMVNSSIATSVPLAFKGPLVYLTGRALRSLQVITIAV